MNNISFSIILSVYNGEKYLEECLQSILAQKYNSWELIIIDDGSIDSSEIIYINYLYDSRIKLIKKNNTGVSDSRNRGLEIAKGKYILFVDADDMLEKNALKTIKKEIDKNEYDLYYFDYKIKTKNKFYISKFCTEYKAYNNRESINKIINFSIRQSQWYSQKWYGNLRPVWNKCFRKEIIDKYHLKFINGLKYGEDMVFILSFLTYAQNIKFINKCFYIFRKNQASTMHVRKWEGIEQGKLYFSAVEYVVNEWISESALADLWLETAEADWALLILSKKKFNYKLQTFKKLLDDDLYKRFSKKNAIKYSSKKQALYCFFIRNKMILGLMILSYIRARKHLLIRSI